MRWFWKWTIALLVSCVPFALVAEITIPGTFIWFTSHPTRKLFLAMTARIGGAQAMGLLWLLAILTGCAYYTFLSRRFPPQHFDRNHCISCQYDLTGNNS